MDIIIEIGREPKGEHVIKVPPKYSKASRRHAFIYWRDGVATLEDNDSTNGTYVNGNRIRKTQIHKNDIVWLGGFGSDCCRLDVEETFALCREIETARRKDHPRPKEDSHPKVSPENVERTDYTKEFARLKQTYINYHAELSELKNKSTKRMQLPRILLSLIPALLGLVFMFVLGFGSMGFIAMSLGSVLSGVIGTMTMGKNNSRQEEMAEKILDLQLKYEDEYKCPKCGKKYSLDLHWKKLQADGKCPYGCGAQFVKQ